MRTRRAATTGWSASREAGSDEVVERLTATLEGRYAIERRLGEGGMATVDHHDAVLADREALIDWRDVIVDVGDRVAGLVADGGTFEEVGGG